jgi:hypothetical protein
LLDALNDPAADTDHVGLINSTALAHSVVRDVLSLTGGKQNPAIEVRFDTTVFGGFVARTRLRFVNFLPVRLSW